MALKRNWRTEMCADGGTRGASLIFVLALAMALIAVPAVVRAQQPTGAGTASSPAGPQAAEPTPAADTAAVSQDNSSEAASSPAAKAAKQESATQTPQTSAPPKATLADFAWLVGRWQGAWGPRVAQQAWLPPKAGVMLGTFQLVDNGKTLVIELYTLVEKPDGIDYYFRHFTPTLAPWETSKPTLMKLASSTPKAIEFDNPVDGQPKRSIMRRVDADTYVSRSEIVPDKGDPQVIEITYHRQKESPPPKR